MAAVDANEDALEDMIGLPIECARPDSPPEAQRR
jgi:hypothetical protein